jgi:polyphenol oxidase
LLKAANLAPLPGVAHGFFTRRGGVSEGLYASLNCGPGSADERDAVIENRRRAMQALSEDCAVRLVTAYQIHSADAVTVRVPWQIGEAPRADAMATATPGIALGILTADCAPVLLADPLARVIGAAHAGWRGAISGVIDAALDAMEQLGGRRARITAAIGPCIGQSSYEVGAEFRAVFVEADERNARLFSAGQNPTRWNFDLRGYVERRLKQAGVENVYSSTQCTYASEQDLFSFRRTTHRGEKDYGRQLSAIALLP